MTNYDWVNTLTIEQLAKFIDNISTVMDYDICNKNGECIYNCQKCILNWLKQQHKY